MSVLRFFQAWGVGLVLLIEGCGAKTPLLVPDAGLDAEVMTMTPITTTCVSVPFNGTDVILPLETTAQIGRADVALLLDVSSSMDGEISAIRRELRDVIVPGIERQIPEVRMSVSGFSDFPLRPYGEPLDSPFTQRIPMTGDIADVQGALDGILMENGGDQPEAHVEALYQLATGEGLPGWVEPSLGCATGGFGYPCFRPDALPVVLLFTDAAMHAGPTGSEPYDGGVEPPPHRYEDARRALVDRGIRIISFFSGTRGSPNRLDLELLARDTGSVTVTGTPQVFDIGTDGRGLGSDVIDAIKVFADTLVFDIDLVVRDDQPEDGIDAAQFVDRIVPVSANPPDGVQEIDRDAGVFRQVTSGTDVVFELHLRNDVVAPGRGPQRFILTGVFRADGRGALGEVSFEIVVPGEDGDACQ